MKKLLIIFLVLIPIISMGKHKQRESYYQNIWCSKMGGITEVVLPDRTRCDCITENFSIEVDFAKKFYEAIGQSLYYGFQTNKNPGILLIIENKKDLKYWIRLNAIIKFYKLDVKVWKVENYE